MKTAALFVAVMALPLAAQTSEVDRTVSKRFPLSRGAAPEIVVRVVSGDIRVTAHDGAEVIVNAKLHFEAPDAAGLADLEKRVRLESEQQGNNIWIGVETDDWNNGSGSSTRPREFGWRNRTPPDGGSSGKNNRRWHWRHDVELRVPRSAHLKLSTVNGGTINVSGVTGEFNLSNVNGGIEVKDADGFGRAHTVNGAVAISFRRNPSGATSVKTVNGKVTLEMPSELNADVKIKTMNGRIYSDFAMAAGPASSTEATEKGMKRIWTTNRFSNLRIGNGGPEIQIDGLNGDVQILKRKS